MTYAPHEKNGYCTVSETYDKIWLPGGSVQLKPVGWMWIHWTPGRGETKGAYVNSLADAQAKAQAEARRINAVYVPHVSQMKMGTCE